ncbi:MAG: hypothetical protein GY711_09675 [bacterium]|nr:hypothetical protein [bacterium]
MGRPRYKRRRRSGRVERAPEPKRESKREASLRDYLKEAFNFRWNLLGVIAGVGAAVLSPAPAIILPIVGIAELLYLSGVVSIPRFRSAVDRKVHMVQSEEDLAETRKSPQLTLHELLTHISRDARERFENLRERCLDMHNIASGVTGRAKNRRTRGQFAAPGLDRLLWVFLRLLVSEHSLNRFLDSTDEGEIRGQIEDARTRLEGTEATADERMVRSLRDNLATSELRLENYSKAQQNAEFVSLELDRIERKIQAISEMSVNRQDPDFISREVDSVAESITQTEAAMNELHLVTGLMEDLNETPVILDSDFEEAVGYD